MTQYEKPYVQTFTIVAGSLVCNAKCPYCVAKMTPHQGVENKLIEYNGRNLDLAARLAKFWGAATVLITSKGEATLFPEQISCFMQDLDHHDFPMIELQTNGIELIKDDYDIHLEDWHLKGMTTISVSMAHYDLKKNGEIFQPHKENPLELENLITKLHDLDFSVRLTCIMNKDYIGDLSEVLNLIDFAQKQKVEQLTVLPLRAPLKSENKEVYDWVKEHELSRRTIKKIKNHLDKKGTVLRNLVHGAVIYDYKGQNICLNDCLTITPKENVIRQIIFFPDGHVRYDWQHKGAILF